LNSVDEISGKALDLSIRLHRELGPGLLESVYETVLAAKLAEAGYRVERLNSAHAKQLLTYLRLTRQPVGLLINFGGATLKEGFKRLVNDYDPSASPRLCANPIPQ
jgi:iron complex transport system substrate-binding protein